MKTTPMVPIESFDQAKLDRLNELAYKMFRKALGDTGISTSEILGKAQSLMCFRGGSGMVTVETPGKQVKEHCKLLSLEVPAHLNVNEFAQSIIG